MSRFKTTSLLFASTLALTGIAHAADTRGHIVAVNQGQIEIQLRKGEVAQEGAIYKITHYRAGSPKDVTANLRLYAGRLQITMPMPDGRAHAQVLDGQPKPRRRRERA